MVENKSLVVYYDYCAGGESPEEEKLTERIHELMDCLATEDVGAELMKLSDKRNRLSHCRKIEVRKEYPEFLVKDFKTKEELFDFLDEDEPMILSRDCFYFENVPDCLSEIGFTGSDEDVEKCIEYLDAKHFREDE